MTPARLSLLGAGIGAMSGAMSMFLLDPARGARRRALIRNKVARASRKTADVAGATWHDVGNRLVGLKSRTRSFFKQEPVDDVTLTERIRTALGRVTAHQRAISVSAKNGCVRLTGNALASEVASIVSTVGRVPGVFGVETDLRTHANADRMPILKGGSRRPGTWRSRIAESRIGAVWSPAAFLAAGSAIAVVGAAMARGKRDLIVSQRLTA
jgi:gas vesicle protein